MIRTPRNSRATRAQHSTYIIALAALMAFCWPGPSVAQQPAAIRFVVTSDAHYGITRPMFRGRANANAQMVNQALVAQINRLPDPIDFVVETGDVVNRQEGVGAAAIQSATTSWRQFERDYIDGVTVTDGSGRRAPVFVVPGNHEASNAVGFHQPMTPPVDAGAMIAIFNRMMRPAVPLTTSTFDYYRDRVSFSRDVGGVHFVFVPVWPDSAARRWLDGDLARIEASTPVLLFTHDQPDVEAKHLRNPNGARNINAVDRFENLLSDTLADGATVDTPTVTEQRALEAFLRRHRNIVGYFHGNSNWNEFYTWRGPDGTLGLRVFRVDSPMKGKMSSQEERKLSFQVATIDLQKREMTVRECLWNAEPDRPSAPLAWGDSVTVPLKASSRP